MELYLIEVILTGKISFKVLEKLLMSVLQQLRMGDLGALDMLSLLLLRQLKRLASNFVGLCTLFQPQNFVSLVSLDLFSPIFNIFNLNNLITGS